MSKPLKAGDVFTTSNGVGLWVWLGGNKTGDSGAYMCLIGSDNNIIPDGKVNNATSPHTTIDCKVIFNITDLYLSIIKDI